MAPKADTSGENDPNPEGPGTLWFPQKIGEVKVEGGFSQAEGSFDKIRKARCIFL